MKEKSRRLAKLALFTLGNVYSTSDSGASKQLKEIIQIKHNIGLRVRQA